LANEVAEVISNDPDAEILLIGDFNEDPTDDNVRILQSVKMSSMMAPMMGQPKVGTYVYKGVDYFLDQIIISNGLNDDEGLTAGKAHILDKPFYRQQEGNYAHYPFRFWAGNKLLGGYSDHLAVYVEIRKVSE
jgi:predicted extracellular nuclease